MLKAFVRCRCETGHEGASVAVRRGDTRGDCGSPDKRLRIAPPIAAISRIGQPVRVIE